MCWTLSTVSAHISIRPELMLMKEGDLWKHLAKISVQNWLAVGVHWVAGHYVVFDHWRLTDLYYFCHHQITVLLHIIWEPLPQELPQIDLRIAMILRVCRSVSAVASQQL